MLLFKTILIFLENKAIELLLPSKKVFVFIGCTMVAIPIIAGIGWLGYHYLPFLCKDNAGQPMVITATLLWQLFGIYFLIGTMYLIFLLGVPFISVIALMLLYIGVVESFKYVTQEAPSSLKDFIKTNWKYANILSGKDERFIIVWELPDGKNHFVKKDHIWEDLDVGPFSRHYAVYKQIDRYFFTRNECNTIVKSSDYTKLEKNNKHRKYKHVIVKVSKKSLKELGII